MKQKSCVCWKERLFLFLLDLKVVRMYSLDISPLSCFATLKASERSFQSNQNRKIYLLISFCPDSPVLIVSTSHQCFGNLFCLFKAIYLFKVILLAFLLSVFEMLMKRCSLVQLFSFLHLPYSGYKCLRITQESVPSWHLVVVINHSGFASHHIDLWVLDSWSMCNFVKITTALLLSLSLKPMLTNIFDFIGLCMFCLFEDP